MRNGSILLLALDVHSPTDKLIRVIIELLAFQRDLAHPQSLTVKDVKKSLLSQASKLFAPECFFLKSHTTKFLSQTVILRQIMFFFALSQKRQTLSNCPLARFAFK
jgi:hypothetical protein